MTLALRNPRRGSVHGHASHLVSKSYVGSFAFAAGKLIGLRLNKVRFIRTLRLIKQRQGLKLGKRPSPLRKLHNIERLKSGDGNALSCDDSTLLLWLERKYNAKWSCDAEAFALQCIPRLNAINSSITDDFTVSRAVLDPILCKLKKTKRVDNRNVCIESLWLLFVCCPCNVCNFLTSLIRSPDWISKLTVSA